MNYSIYDLIEMRSKRVPGEAYKLQGALAGMDVPFVGNMEFDQSEMSIVIPFASGHRRDGVGDLLEVGGIDTSRHKLNPVVLFDHGKVVALPVAQAEDPMTREYTVQIDPVEKTARAKAFFYQGKKPIHNEGYEPDKYFPTGQQEYDHALFCEQLFDMMVKRYIRAGSIGYQVIAARDLMPDFDKGTPKGLHLLKTLLLEVSAVVLPANQDTVAKALSLPRVCGKPMSPMLVKSLAPYAPPRKAMMGYEGKAYSDIGQIEGERGAYTPPKLQEGQAYNPTSGQTRYNASVGGTGDQANDPKTDIGHITKRGRGREINYFHERFENRPTPEDEKNLPRQGRKSRTPNRYRGDPPTLPGEGYNDSRNIGVGASTANPNSVAGAETIVNLQHHTNQINAAERSRRMAEIQRQHHGLDEEETEEKNLPRQGRKTNKRPTYRDVGAVPRVGHFGPADEQADLDQPFDNPAGLYSRSNYLPSSPDDPNTLAGHFAYTQEDGHDHMISSRSEANDLAVGHREDMDIGEQGPYVPRPHPRDIKRKSVDKLSGGLADDKQPQDFDPAQLKAGIKVEMEHTDDPRMAREIAMDHLSEDPAYYQKLSRMEGKRLPRQGIKANRYSMGPDRQKEVEQVMTNPNLSNDQRSAEIGRISGRASPLFEAQANTNQGESEEGKSVKNLRMMYGTKTAKGKDESNKDYALRMYREEQHNAHRQRDQRNHDYQNSLRAAGGGNPDNDVENLRGERDFHEADRASERNYERRLQGGKSVKDLRALYGKAISNERLPIPHGNLSKTNIPPAKWKPGKGAIKSAEKPFYERSREDLEGEMRQLSRDKVNELKKRGAAGGGGHHETIYRDPGVIDDDNVYKTGLRRTESRQAQINSELHRRTGTGITRPDIHEDDEKGFHLFSGNTQRKIGKYTDRAFQSYHSGQISGDQLQQRLDRARNVLRAMHDADSQNRAKVEAQRDAHNQSAVSGSTLGNTSKPSTKDIRALYSRRSKSLPGPIVQTKSKNEELDINPDWANIDISDLEKSVNALLDMYKMSPDQ